LGSGFTSDGGANFLLPRRDSPTTNVTTRPPRRCRRCLWPFAHRVPVHPPRRRRRRWLAA